jgi:hypothetical protein
MSCFNQKIANVFVVQAREDTGAGCFVGSGSTYLAKIGGWGRQVYVGKRGRAR